MTVSCLNISAARHNSIVAIDKKLTVKLSRLNLNQHFILCFDIEITPKRNNFDFQVLSLLETLLHVLFHNWKINIICKITITTNERKHQVI